METKSFACETLAPSAVAHATYFSSRECASSQSVFHCIRNEVSYPMKNASTVNGRGCYPLNPFTTYQHMRPRLREEPVSIYLQMLLCCNSGGIFLLLYSYRISASAALCAFQNKSTVSVNVFDLLIYALLY